MSEELKALKKRLLKDDRNGYDVLSAADLEKMEHTAPSTRRSWTPARRKSASARAAIALAEKHGFVEYKPRHILSAGTSARATTVPRSRMAYCDGFSARSSHGNGWQPLAWGFALRPGARP